jgi:hypothetical protein
MTRAFTKEQVCQMYGFSRHEYYRVCASGCLPFVRTRPGGQRRHYPEHLAYYEQQTRLHGAKRDKRLATITPESASDEDLLRVRRRAVGVVD